MPYSDPEERRAYHRAYMHEWRAKQPKPAPKPRKNACTLTEEELRARQLAYVRAYQAKYPERVKEARVKANDKLKAKGYWLRWTKDNPEKVKVYQDRYNLKNPGKDRVRKSRLKHIDKRRTEDAALKRRMRRDDPEGYRQAMAQWRANNPERIADYNNERQRLAKGRLSRGLRSLLMSEQGGKCPYCSGNLITLGATFDHYTPLKLGGKHVNDNIQLVCKSCNSRKHGKDPARFLLETFRLEN
jgi:5-methylcytosine-specific restriction endonuclease McrA